MANQFTMTIEEASRQYHIPEKTLLDYAQSADWARQEICNRDGSLLLNPHNFDLWYQWMKKRAAASRKERKSRKWYFLASAVLFCVAFVVTHLVKQPSLASVSVNLAFAVLPMLAVWRCISMVQIPKPEYEIRGNRQRQSPRKQKHEYREEDIFGDEDIVSDPLYRSLSCNIFHQD